MLRDWSARQNGQNRVPFLMSFAHAGLMQIMG
jgi:hypothetical protein